MVVALRNSLVPENTTSAKFTTNLGPDLDQVGGVVYVGSPPGEQQKPLWIKVDEIMFPTGMCILPPVFMGKGRANDGLGSS